MQLHIHLHAVKHKYLALASHPDLITIKQFELSCTFIVVVLDANASPPLLYLPRLGPEPDIHWFWTVQYQSCC